MKALVLVLLLLIAVPSFAQNTWDSSPGRFVVEKFKPSYQVSHDVLYGGALFDLGSTLEGMHYNRVETNPFFRSQNRAVISTSIIGTTIAVDIATHYLARHGHRRLASAFNYGIGGLHGIAGIHNVK